jgi:eukaryotic-like serine/threonine-protein kinase
VSSLRTTRCCSAIALVVLATAVIRSQPSKSTTGVLGLFPARPLWTLPLNNGLIAPPGFATDRGYFPIDGDRLAAYDLASGTLRWLIAARVQSQPAVGDHLIFVVEPDALVAFRDEDGAVAWRVSFAEPLAQPLAWTNGWLIAATTSSSVIALRAADGSKVWQQDVGARIHALPALSGDRVYVATEDGLITVLALHDGRRIWAHRIGGAGTGILALERVFVGSTDNFLYCLSATDGRILWSWRTGGDVIGAPIADDHRVYFVSLDNMVRALDRTVGNQRWLKPLPMRPSRGPVMVGDVVLVTGNGPVVRAFAAKDGANAGDLPAGNGVSALPHVDVRGGLPAVTLVVADLAKGMIVNAFERSLDPAETPIVPLPDRITPQTPFGAPVLKESPPPGRK